jgi:hypothetical protein
MEGLYGSFVDPSTGEKLGRRPMQFASYQERLAAKLEAEPDATPERRRELEFEVAKSHRKAVHYFDLTFSRATGRYRVCLCSSPLGRHSLQRCCRYP